MDIRSKTKRFIMLTHNNKERKKGNNYHFEGVGYIKSGTPSINIGATEQTNTMLPSFSIFLPVDPPPSTLPWRIILAMTMGLFIHIWWGRGYLMQIKFILIQFFSIFDCLGNCPLKKRGGLFFYDKIICRQILYIKIS